MADETATTSGEEHVASPPKVSKVKEISGKAKKLHQNWLLIRMPQNMHYWLMKQPPHQVRNMLLHPQKYLKSKNIKRCNTSKGKGKKAAPKLVVNQNATKHALLADETATTSGEEHVASPPKVSKVKEISGRAKKLHQNWLLIRMPQNMHYWLMKQPPHQVRNMLLHPPKVSKVKEISGKVKKAAPKQVAKKCNTSKGIWKGQKSCTKTGY